MNLIELEIILFLLFMLGVLGVFVWEFGADAIKQTARDAVNVIKLLAKKEK
jgi:hypothetical protein